MKGISNIQLQAIYYNPCTHLYMYGYFKLCRHIDFHNVAKNHLVVSTEELMQEKVISCFLRDPILAKAEMCQEISMHLYINYPRNGNLSTCPTLQRAKGPHIIPALRIV